ncbi:type VII secretion target [Rhodococcus sp. HNM0569]|uniref:type VII secretion target n=1 Tax=Rhodococcus sp. HNM0569 TaxID=2716340 RepID=UPI00146B660F|nr:type VII secretion target [Rhodococcus sp. HNM0569]NLU81841.1 hypothetical protein [Rhodococcus sp. HNM0569]
MEQLHVELDSVAGFAATTAAMAAQMQAAATAAAAGAELLGPAFGLIGGDFLAAFATVQGAHIASIEKLALVYGGISAAAASSAAGYADTDTATGAGFAGTEVRA